MADRHRAAVDVDLGDAALERRRGRARSAWRRRRSSTLAAPLMNSSRPSVTPASGAVNSPVLRRAAPVAAPAPPAAPARRCARDQLLVELADAAQVVADHGDAGRVDLLELRAAGELDLAVDARAELARGGRRGDQHAAAVAGVGDAVGVAVALHAVEHGGDRPRSEAALFGELAGGDAAAPVEDADAAQVGAVEAELRRPRPRRAGRRCGAARRARCRPRRSASARVVCHASPRCGQEQVQACDRVAASPPASCFLGR